MRYDWIDSIPQGWSRLGHNLEDELVKLDHHIRILDAKEKYGALRIEYNWYELQDEYGYESWDFDKIHLIINKYTDLSRHTCTMCGIDTTDYLWTIPMCEKCKEII